jgi:hypothetical protein
MLRFLLALAVLSMPAPAAAGERLPAEGSVEVAFSPADDPEALLVELIGAARSSLHVQAYIFTSRLNCSKQAFRWRWRPLMPPRTTRC